MNLDHYEQALTSPLSPKIGKKKLELLRLDILQFLHWYSTDPFGDNPERVNTEIQRCADRLKEIAALVPYVSGRRKVVAPAKDLVER